MVYYVTYIICSRNISKHSKVWALPCERPP